MTTTVLQIVCSSRGFRCCAKGEQLCDEALEHNASFCTLEEYEARYAGEGR